MVKGCGLVSHYLISPPLLLEPFNIIMPSDNHPGPPSHSTYHLSSHSSGRFSSPPTSEHQFSHSSRSQGSSRRSSSPWSDRVMSDRRHPHSQGELVREACESHSEKPRKRTYRRSNSRCRSHTDIDETLETSESDNDDQDGRKRRRGRGSSLKV